MSRALEDLPVIGAISPRRDGLDAPFWAALNAGEFRMQRCCACRAWWWAPVWRCGDCGSFDLEWEETEARGVVYSWMRTHQAFSPEMAAIVPYVNVIVSLPEAGDRRLIGLLVGPEDGLAIGAAVTGVIQPASPRTSHQAVLRWRLEPAKG